MIRRKEMERAVGFKALRVSELAEIRQTVNTLRALAQFLESGMECAVLNKPVIMPEGFASLENKRICAHVQKRLHLSDGEMKLLLGNNGADSEFPGIQKALTQLRNGIETEVLPRYGVVLDA